uniref:Uncharacterized protein n=1 Tax=Rhodnius prolixus TaxID=13249 RepID=T1IE54_RHOPR
MSFPQQVSDIHTLMIRAEVLLMLFISFSFCSFLGTGLPESKQDRSFSTSKVGTPYRMYEI